MAQKKTYSCMAQIIHIPMQFKYDKLLYDSNKTYSYSCMRDHCGNDLMQFDLQLPMQSVPITTKVRIPLILKHTCVAKMTLIVWAKKDAYFCASSKKTHFRMGK